jgi:amidohydrolase
LEEQVTPSRLGPEAIEEMIATRRELHLHPETAFTETWTARLIGDRLRSLGLRVREGVGGTGVVADLGEPGNSPKLVLRAEMDALPLQEVEGRDFASNRPGVMHACGHDAHMAILVCVAGQLVRSGGVNGLVRFLFQPAEETGEGARAMLDDNALDDFSWDAALAIHLRPFIQAGSVGICDGPATARVGEFTVTVTGTGGHGGRPHVSTDALLTGAEIVSAIQTVIPREVSTFEPAVLSVCSFHSGNALNVIPDVARVGGTIRASSDEVYEYLFGRLEDLATAIGEGFRCHTELRRRDTMPSVRNHPRMVELARTAAADVVGLDRVLAVEPVMAGDDVALLFQQVPGCYVFLGAAHDDGRAAAPNHSPSWDFDERAMIVGAELMLGVVDRLMDEAP